MRNKEEYFSIKIHCTTIKNLLALLKKSSCTDIDCRGDSEKPNE